MFSSIFMHKNPVILLSALLVLSCIMVLSGCVSQPATPVQTPVVTPTPVSTPVDTSTPSVTIPPEEVPRITTTVPVTGSSKSSSDPYVNIGSIRSTAYLIPNCTMGELVPAVKEPGYGLNSIKDSKLVFLTHGDYNKVIREYSENQGAISVCYRQPESPYWVFSYIDSTLTARNSRPTTYNVTLVVKFRGADGPKYSTQMTLNPGQMYPVQLYVPIRNDQARELSNIEFQFTPVG
jgi:hypothetical protein